MNTTILFILGSLLRIGIPVAITAVILYLLNRLDKRWQKEAIITPVIPTGKPCWEVKGCSAQKMKNCPAASQPYVPCWQVFRGKDGVLKDACLECEVFRQSPAPVKV
jgi:hypothetical protein